MFTVGNDQQNATIEALLASAPIDAVVEQTLKAVSCDTARYAHTAYHR